MNAFHIQLAKETFKFSASHFTLLSHTEAERLHGHNYQVAIECEVSQLGPFGMAFEFNTLKPLIKRLTDRWDERVLIPVRSPHLKFRDEFVRGEPHLIVDFNSRSYRFPKSDLIQLDTENITSEELARLFAQDLTTEWKTTADASLASRVRLLRVKVEETRGQSAAFVVQEPLRQSATT